MRQTLPLQLQAILLTSLSSRSRAFSASVSSSTTYFASPSPASVGRSAGALRSQRLGSRRSMSTCAQGSKHLVVDPFCFRQFAETGRSEGYAGTVFNISIEEFEDIVNSHYDASRLKDGYAPFCKHLFVVNDFTQARVNVLPITPENEHCLRTKYEARNEKELPVLTRHFDRALLLKDRTESDVFPVAKYLDLILYSREQIEKENAAMAGGEDAGGEKETAPWGIVSIKAQDVDRELPMTPITAMRNALGKDQGGSGVALVREAYLEACEYWRGHANVL